MKELLNNGGDLIKSPASLIKISAFFFISFTFFYLGKHYSDVGYHNLIFSSSSASTSSSPSISISPNLNKPFNFSSLINSSTSTDTSPSLTSPLPQPPPPPLPPSPPPLKTFGVVDENGMMTDDFEIGEYDPTVVENWGNVSESHNDAKESEVKIRVSRFPMCAESMREYIPCMDNEEAIKHLNSTERGERFERHCPENGKGLNCLVPPPKNYKIPIPWPRSRDEV